MTGLVYNEIQKIVTQRRFVIVVGIFTLLAIAIALSTRGPMGQMSISAASIVSTWTYGFLATFLFPILVAGLVGDTVAGELSGGTLKLLLIRPASRWKIWLSKLLAAYLTSAVTFLYFAIVMFVAFGAASGFGSFSAHTGGDPTLPTIGVVTLESYGLVLLSILSVVSVFLLLSTLVETGSAANFLCFMSVVASSVLAGLINSGFLSNKWLQYLFFVHWGLAAHVNNAFQLENWSLRGSVFVLISWIVVCAGAGMALFQFRDVKS